MQPVKSPAEMTRLVMSLKREGKWIGFVPTMGYLHEGHRSLIRRARKESGAVVVSVFVNPTQFGPKEDFKRYPRNAARDAAMLKKEKVDFLFAPSVRGIYPKGSRARLNPGSLARGLCGPKRPGHFRGVVTVVKRLFDIIRPGAAYFGQKDYQQARIIEAMIRRFRLPIRMVICPIVRERDGLAMSSRNVYLSRSERLRARAIPRTLELARRLIRRRVPPREVEWKAKLYLKPYVDSIDYICVVDPETLRPASSLKKGVLVALACFVGRTRLIDNMLIRR